MGDDRTGRVCSVEKKKTDSLKQKLISGAQQKGNSTLFMSMWQMEHFDEDFRGFLFWIRGTGLNGFKLITDIWSKLLSSAKK